jgi:uncharacterized protein YjbI with pentapeptide repeats
MRPCSHRFITDATCCRTLWDWVTLGLISGAITFVGLVYTSSQAVQQRYVQDQQAKDAALQAYLDQMSTLMLDHDLRTAEKNGPERDLARARTLTVVKRQSPESKGDIVNFLYEADLIKGDQPTGDQPIVSLVAANLKEVQLNNAALEGVDLHETYLQKAEFHWADTLRDSDLHYSDLSDADLSTANLSDADLSTANLSGANLRGDIDNGGITTVWWTLFRYATATPFVLRSS